MMTTLALAALLACQQPPQTINVDIVMRYYFKSKSEPTGLKVELMKNRSVKDVTFDTRNRLATVRYSGRISEIRKLEDAVAPDARIISHVPVAFSFKPLPGARPDIIGEELKLIEGSDPNLLKVSGNIVEVMADLRRMTYHSIARAATNASFEFTLRGPVAWMDVYLKKGDFAKITSVLEREDALLVMKTDARARRISMWIVPQGLDEARVKEIVDANEGELDRVEKY